MSRILTKLTKHPDLIFLLVILLIACLTQGYPLLSSFLLTPQGTGSPVLHDSLWHLSIINQLAYNSPPLHPGMSGYTLANYHYFSDVFLYQIQQLTHIQSIFVYFRIAPIIAASGFTITTFLLARQLTQTKLAAYFGTLLVLFSGSLSWIIPLLWPGKIWPANSIMLDQPFDQLTNAHTYFGFSLFLLGTHLLIKSRQKSKILLVLAGVIFGFTLGVKAYASFIALAALATASLFQILTTKKTTLAIWGLIPALIIFTFLFSKTINQSQQQLIFSPGWLLEHMAQDTDRFNFPSNFTNKKLAYISTHNYLYLFLLYFHQLFWYLIGNLSTRIISLIVFLSWLFHYKRINPTKIFLLSVVIISLSMPILFHQGKSSYNSVQFAPYGLIVSSLLSALVIEKLPLNKTKLFFIFTFIFTLSLPTSAKTFYEYVSQTKTHHQISNFDLQALKYLKQNSTNDDVVLTPPGSQHDLFMIVPAISSRTTYYSGAVFAPLTGIDPTDKLSKRQILFDLSSTLSQKKNFLISNNISHIYLHTDDQQLINHLTQNNLVTNFYSNQEITILKTTPNQP